VIELLICTKTICVRNVCAWSLHAWRCWKHGGVVLMTLQWQWSVVLFDSAPMSVFFI